MNINSLDFSSIFDEVKTDSENLSYSNVPKSPAPVRWLGLDNAIVNKYIDLILVCGYNDNNKLSIKRFIEYFPLKSRTLSNDKGEYVESKIKIKNSEENLLWLNENFFNKLDESEKFKFNIKQIYQLVGFRVDDNIISADNKFPINKNKFYSFIMDRRLYADFSSHFIMLKPEELNEMSKGNKFIRISFGSNINEKTGKEYINITSINILDTSEDTKKSYLESLDKLKTEWDGRFKSLYLDDSELDLTNERKEGILLYINEMNNSFSQVTIQNNYNSNNNKLSNTSSNCLILHKFNTGEISKDEYEKLGSPKMGNHPASNNPICKMCEFEGDCIMNFN